MQKVHRLTVMFKCLGKDSDLPLDYLINSNIHSYRTKSRNNIHLLKVKTNWGKQRFAYQAAY